MLRRKIAAELERWLKSSEQKALFITGSRQIGKSYSIRAFGKANHATYIELNLMENRQAKDALLEARNADDFISRVTLLSGKSIAPGKTLVFIDEVQEAPDIMTMAKFLVEDGRCRWAFSGSMLGTQFKGVRSYPVGYVHELRMFPLDFEEFCWATGVSEGARQTIRDACISERPVPDYIHDAMMANFRTYTVVGGMPEVVQRFLDTQGDLASVRQLQSELNEQYRRDISKYASGRSLQVQSIYDQLPIMLEGENKRFVLNSIDPKAHYEKYQRDFVWLVDAGVALKADIVTEPKSPLLKTARPSQFKLYQSDTGMLMARYPVGVAQAAYLDSKEPNLGGIYENVVAQQLAAQNRQLYYYQTKKRGEVDFVVDGPDGTAVPIEVKSGSYYHAHAALGHVLDTAEYGVRLGIVFSRGNVERNGAVLYLPLYATWALSDVLGDSCAEGIKLEVKRSRASPGCDKGVARDLDCLQLLEHSGAAVEYVAVGGIEIAGVPGVGHVAGALGPIEHARNLAVGVVAKDATQATRVLVVHIDNVVPVAILRATHLTCTMCDDGNPDLAQLGNGTVVWRVADLLGRGRSGVNDKLARAPARRTSSVNTDSAIVERQMFP